MPMIDAHAVPGTFARKHQLPADLAGTGTNAELVAAARAQIAELSAARAGATTD